MANMMIIEVHDGILAASLRECWVRVVFLRIICCFRYVRRRCHHFALLAMDSTVTEWTKTFATVVKNTGMGTIGTSLDGVARARLPQASERPNMMLLVTKRNR